MFLFPWFSLLGFCSTALLVSCRYQPLSLLSTKIRGIFNSTLRHGVLHSLFQRNSELWKLSSLWPAFPTRPHPSTTALELGQRPFSQSDELALQVGSGGGGCGNPLSAQHRISALQVSWGVGNQGPSTLTCQAWSRASAPQVRGLVLLECLSAVRLLKNGAGGQDAPASCLLWGQTTTPDWDLRRDGALGCTCPGQNLHNMELVGRAMEQSGAQTPQSFTVLIEIL